MLGQKWSFLPLGSSGSKNQGLTSAETLLQNLGGSGTFSSQLGELPTGAWCTMNKWPLWGSRVGLHHRRRDRLLSAKV
jgi:hypothetical protein